MILIFFPLSLWVFIEPRDWWFRGNSAQHAEDYGLPTEPHLDGTVLCGLPGSLAACAEWQKQLSHLLHSIFICQPASGVARGDLDPPQRSIFVQQVKLCSKEPPKQTSFTRRRAQNPHPSFISREENIHTRKQSSAFRELEETVAVTFFFKKMTISQCDLKCFLSRV